MALPFIRLFHPNCQPTQPVGCFMVGWQLRKQPERYVTLFLKMVRNNEKIIVINLNKKYIDLGVFI
jgi:hypothetical protein